MPNRPLGDLDCAELGYASTGSACTIARNGWNHAFDSAVAAGLFDQSSGPSGFFPSLTVPEAQTLLQVSIPVLATAFCARLIIQLVKKG